MNLTRVNSILIVEMSDSTKFDRYRADAEEELELRYQAVIDDLIQNLTQLPELENRIEMIEERLEQLEE